MDSMVPKDQKYNLHYEDVREDVSRPPHGTILARVKVNKFG